MRLNRESLGNLLQNEASCAIYSFSVDVQPKKRSEWTFNQRNATSGRNGRSRPVAVILRHDVSFGVRSGACGSVRHDSEPSIRFGLRYLGVRHVHRLLSLYCHDRISNNDGKTTFSPTIAESRTSQDAQKPQRAFFRSLRSEPQDCRDSPFAPLQRSRRDVWKTRHGTQSYGSI